MLIGSFGKNNKMRIALLTVAYPPLRSSGAILMQDLVDVWKADGHQIYVFTPDNSMEKTELEEQSGSFVLRFNVGKVRDVGYARRLFNEFFMPYKMIFQFSQSKYKGLNFDGVVMYSPSIFLYPLAWYLKKKSNCICYLVLRDIFPRWASDLGLIRNKISFNVLNCFSKQQLKVADFIGVQSHGNIRLFDGEPKKIREKIEVLNNWMSKPSLRPSSISDKTKIFGTRKILVYAGNMGKAQGIETLLKAVTLLKEKTDFGFLFIGRGSEFDSIKIWKEANNLDNFLLFDEVPVEELSDIYLKCAAGLISLDVRHTTHNIPGKLISYLNAGLPVIAFVNKGNDLISAINTNLIGIATDDHSETSIARVFDELPNILEEDNGVSDRCRSLALSNFSSDRAANQIIAALRRK